MNKQNTLSLEKALPFLLVLLILGLVVIGIVWITSQPEVIQAKGEWANATANLFQAKQVYHQQLPEILSKATILALAGFLSFGVLAFIISLSASLLISNVDRVVAHGWEFEKNANGQRTTFKLGQSNPVPYKLGPGQQPRISVEQPKQGMLPRGTQPQQGRKLRPEERQAPGRNPMKNQIPEPGYTSLGSGMPQQLSREDPLSILEDNQVF